MGRSGKAALRSQLLHSKKPGEESEGFAGKGETKGGTSSCKDVCEANWESCSRSRSQFKIKVPCISSKHPHNPLHARVGPEHLAGPMTSHSSGLVFRCRSHEGKPTVAMPAPHSLQMLTKSSLRASLLCKEEKGTGGAYVLREGPCSL